MDPFSAEGELLNLHSAFHQGQYEAVLSLPTADLSPSNALPAQILQLRARLALGQAIPVLSELKGTTDSSLRAVACLALLLAGQDEKAAGLADLLVAEAPENKDVQVLVGTVLIRLGRTEEAVGLLGGEGSLDGAAVLVQAYLAGNRTDAAAREVAGARRWAQDSLLVNLAEAWVGLRLGGERYQQAFYVFEELAQAPSTTSLRSLISQAISELHLGRLEEAQAALEEALSKDPESADALANMAVLTAVSGKDVSEYSEQLKQVEPTHPFLVDLEEKSALFDQAATKYSPKVTA